MDRRGFLAFSIINGNFKINDSYSYDGCMGFDKNKIELIEDGKVIRIWYEDHGKIGYIFTTMLGLHNMHFHEVVVRYHDTRFIELIMVDEKNESIKWRTLHPGVVIIVHSTRQAY
jgi:hypothetical protein